MAFIYAWKGMGVRKGVKTVIPPPLLEIGTKNQTFLANLKSGA